MPFVINPRRSAARTLTPVGGWAIGIAMLILVGSIGISNADAMSKDDDSIPASSEICTPDKTQFVPSMNASYTRATCTNIAGLALFSEPNVATHVDYLRKTRSWFACGRVIQGKSWLYTIGHDNKKWGWVGASEGNVAQTRSDGTTPGVPDCDAHKLPASVRTVGNLSAPSAGPAAAGSAGVAIAAAREAVGKTPYRWGGASLGGMDCSGLVTYAWKMAGVDLPGRSSFAMSKKMTPLKGGREVLGQLQPGDLIFFYSPVSHVSMYSGDGKMIDAKQTGTLVYEAPITDKRMSSFVGYYRPA